MLKKLLKSISLSMVITAVASASDFQFFSGQIDYWGTKKDAVEPLPKAETKETFPWGKYLDPKNKEFFKEGEYTPPEPFMEIVRNPSDENLKLWFSYIDKKNELAGRLGNRIQEYVSTHGGLPASEKSVLLARANAIPKALPDSHRYRFRMYFDSTCPHCKKMMETLAELQSKGFLVEARQIDNGSTPGTPFPVVRATEKEIKEKEIQSVPLLLIGDLKSKVVYRLHGYQTYQDVMNAVATNQTH